MSKQHMMVFTDLDGTLLDHFTYDFSPVLPMLVKLEAKQIPVICNTSKTFAETIVLREQLDLHTPFIVENGAAVYLPKKLFTQQPDDTIDSGDYWLKTFTKPRAHWLALIEQYKQQHQCSFVGFSKITHKQLVEITGLTLTQVALAKQRQFSEPIQWVDKNDSKSEFIAYLKQAGANVLQGGRFIHVSGHCNKGLAMNWLVNVYQKASLKQTNTTYNSGEITTVALGDSYNDIAMLEAADVAILIRSPVHDFPRIKNQNKDNRATKTKVHKQIYSSELGPKGWAQEINNLLLNTKTEEVNHG